MTSYILLRKNKESGPFSLEDLKREGLKEDDLVWVEGQSVCWLNPGELRELKGLVGLPPETAGEQVIAETVKNPVPTGLPTSLNQAAKTNQKVYVAMPAVTETIPPKKEEPVAKTFSGESAKKMVPPEKEEEKILPETKYSRPLDEIKAMYVKELEKRSLSNRLAGGRLLQIQLSPEIKRAAVYIVLLGMGIAAGLLIRRGSGSKKQLARQEQSSPVSERKETTSGITDNPADNSGQTITPATEENGNNKGLPVIQEPDPPALQLPSERTVAEKRSSAERKTGKTDLPPSPDPVTDSKKEEKKNVSPEAKETKPVAAEELYPLVSVKSNDYTVASFGGIRNLQLTVKNDSKYVLDEVTVELQYLKPRDEWLKTENIYFKSVPPNGTQTIAVPRSNRGVKIACKITKIESKASNSSTAGL